MSETEAQQPVPNVPPVDETTIPEKREFTLKRPGNINWATREGHYPGCRAILFEPVHDIKEPKSAVDAYNDYFRDHANLLVVACEPDGLGNLLVHYTNQLEGEELEDFQELSREISLAMQERKRQRAERERKAEKARDEAQKEVSRLVEKGRTCEAHHAPLLERVKALEAEIKKLKKGKS